MPATVVGRCVEVLTPQETSVSRRSLVTVAVSAAVATGFAAVALAAPTLGRALGSVLLGFGVVLAARAVGSALLAFVRRSPPAPADPARSLPTVSVVVTAYDEADVLAGTIRACLALDYPEDRLELIVVFESASTDGTASIAAAADARDPRVTAVERDGPPGGKAAATNVGLAHATGDVLVVLDADQRPEPGALGRAVRWFRDDDVWCVKGRCFGTNADASVVALCATVERAIAERCEFYARDLVSGFTLFTGGQAFFRATALERLGPFDETILLEDLDMAVRIARAGGEVRVDPGVVTTETNPTTWRAWWHQRKRWARGGMQVAARYLGLSARSDPPSLRTRVDFDATVGGLVVLPVLALAVPGVALARLRADVVLGPLGAAALGFLLATPGVLSGLLFLLDARDGRGHAPREYAAPLLLWPYFGVQCCVVVAAFVEEFVLRRPVQYVTSVEPTDE